MFVNLRLKFCLFIYFGPIQWVMGSKYLNNMNLLFENKKYDTYKFLLQSKKIHFYVKLNYRNMMISTIENTSLASSGEIVNYSVIAIGALILFLALNSILRPTRGSYKIDSVIKGSNLAIVPLLLIFIIIFVYKVISTI